MALRTNYKDDVFSGKRKYKELNNGDGTVSFDDETNTIYFDAYHQADASAQRQTAYHNESCAACDT